MGFCIPKIWLILKRFARSLPISSSINLLFLESDYLCKPKTVHIRKIALLGECSGPDCDYFTMLYNLHIEDTISLTSLLFSTHFISALNFMRFPWHLFSLHPSTIQGRSWPHDLEHYKRSKDTYLHIFMLNYLYLHTYVLCTYVSMLLLTT